MKRFLRQEVAFVVIAASLVQAQDANEVLSRLQRKYESVRDFHASFTQTVRFGVTQSTQQFQGKIWVKQGKKYRIEMEQQTIVTNGISVWTYSALNRQVFIDVFRDDPHAITPDRLLSDAPKNYFATMLDGERLGGRETIVLKLTPKDKKSLLKSLKVWIDPSEWLMVKVEVLDMSDNLTTYTTNNVKINSNVPEGMFELAIPPGVEVIDLRPPSVKSPSDSP